MAVPTSRGAQAGTQPRGRQRRRDATCIRVLLADDHPVLLQGLHKVLESRGFAVVGEAEDGRVAVRLACELRPDATHLFEEPGALDAVARLAREWFERHLVPAAVREAHGGSGADR